jgi:hypothetical protein
VEQVLGNVPPSQRCRCRQDQTKPPSVTDLRSRLKAFLGW